MVIRRLCRDTNSKGGFGIGTCMESDRPDKRRHRKLAPRGPHLEEPQGPKRPTKSLSSTQTDHSRLASSRPKQLESELPTIRDRSALLLVMLVNEFLYQSACSLESFFCFVGEDKPDMIVAKVITPPSNHRRGCNILLLQEPRTELR